MSDSGPGPEVGHDCQERTRCSFAGPAPSCSRCGQPLPTDDVGLVRLSDSDHPWAGVPAPFADAVLASTVAEDVVTAMTSGAHRVGTAVQQRLMHPSGGAAAVLAPVHDGCVVLDLATGWSTLASALRSLGATVTRVEWSLAALRFGQLMDAPPAQHAVHVAPGRPLPFDDGTFDAVFLDVEALERALDVAGGTATPAVRRDAVLADVRRVLGPEGTAVLGTRSSLRSRRTPVSPGERRRSAVHAVAARVRSARRPWGGAALARAGFADLRVLVAHPRRRAGHWLLPAEQVSSRLTEARGTASAAGAAKELLRRSTARLGGGLWLAEDYYVLAHRDPLPGGPPRTLGEHLAPFRAEPTPLVRSLSDARVAMLGGRSFVKLPLSEPQREALLREARNTEAARGTAFGPFTLASVESAQWHGIPYTEFPLVVSRPGAGPDEALVAVRAALEAQPADTLAPLRTTALWQRLGTARGGRDVAEMGAGRLHAGVVDRCGGRVVPVGATHGDLHAANVLLPADGPPLLVDWNRYESRNPLLLDAGYAAVRLHMRQAGVSMEAALLALADDELRGPLADRAAAVRGELLPVQAAVLVLLDRVVSYSEPRRRHKPWTMAPLLGSVSALTRRLDADQG